MTLASFHHHLVIILAGIGGVLFIILLILLLRRRSPEDNAPPEDDQAKRIEERLATGRFSRAPSNFRRKAVVVTAEPVLPPPQPENKPDIEI